MVFTFEMQDEILLGILHFLICQSHCAAETQDSSQIITQFEIERGRLLVVRQPLLLY